MKFISVAASILLTSVAAQASKCGDCTKGDVSCYAACMSLPDPTDEQAEMTTQCNQQCFVDNDATDDCFMGCVKNVYMKTRVTESASSSATKITASSSSSSKSSSSASSESSSSSTDASSASESKSSSPTSIDASSKPRATGKPSSSSKVASGLPSDDESSNATPLYTVSLAGAAVALSLYSL